MKKISSKIKKTQKLRWSDFTCSHSPNFKTFWQKDTIKLNDNKCPGFLALVQSLEIYILKVKVFNFNQKLLKGNRILKQNFESSYTFKNLNDETCNSSMVEKIISSPSWEYVGDSLRRFKLSEIVLLQYFWFSSAI